MSDQTVKYTLTLSDLLSGKLENADAKAQKFDTTMSRLQGTINNVAAAAGIAFGLQGLKQFVGGMIDAGTTVEDAQTGLTTLLKDAGKAKEVIKNTMQDATETPFAFEGLLSANKALISANASAEEARQTVKDLGNAIAATGGGDVELQRMVVNLQQIRNTGKATAQDIKQFAFAGINIYQLLADATGKPIDKVKELDVSYEMLRFALAKAHQAGGLYAGGLENMANNTSVQISNLGDALFQLKVKMFDDLKPAITATIEQGKIFIAWLGDAWKWLKQNKDMIFAVAKGVLVGVAAYKAYKLALQASVLWTKIQYASITLLGDGFLTANAGTKLFAGGLEMLKGAMLTNPIGLMAVAVGALAAAYFAFSKTADTALNSNENFNASLMKTAGIVDKVQQKLSGGIMGGNNAEILGMNYAQLSKYREDAIEREKELSSKIADNEARITNLAQLGAKGGQLQNRLKQIAEIEDQNRILQGNITNLQDLRKRADKRLKELPKPTINNTNAQLDLKSTSKITGNRSVTINIDIKNLIESFTVKTVNLGEAIPEIKSKVVQALMSAVNDSQIIGTQ